jgi:integrase/recombinase XerC/integrase/recombinase XerD
MSDAGLKLTLRALRQHLDGFTGDYLKDKSKETIGTYRRSLRTFEKWFVQQHGRFRFTEDDVRDSARCRYPPT